MEQRGIQEEDKLLKIHDQPFSLRVLVGITNGGTYRHSFHEIALYQQVPNQLKFNIECPMMEMKNATLHYHFFGSLNIPLPRSIHYKIESSSGSSISFFDVQGSVRLRDLDTSNGLLHLPDLQLNEWMEFNLPFSMPLHLYQDSQDHKVKMRMFNR
jgi:hypothetical protein